MNRPLACSVVTLMAALVSSCSGAVVAPPQGATPQVPTPDRVTLPPAWTATPTVPTIPATPTPSPTSHPAVLAARQTATAWPTLRVVAVGAGADSTGWERLEFPTGSLLVPTTFEPIDSRRVDDAITSFMQALAASLVEAMPAQGTPSPGGPTPTALSLEGLTSAFGFDFLVAEDAVDPLTVFVVGGPLPEGLDLETMMTEAAGLLQGEVEITGREIVGGAPRSTGRVFVRLFDRARGTTEDRAIYVILEGDQAWVISYRALDFEPFGDMLPAFETSALSLEPSP